jgi:hypothetical protein
MSMPLMAKPEKLKSSHEIHCEIRQEKNNHISSGNCDKIISTEPRSGGRISNSLISCSLTFELFCIKNAQQNK